jgi:type IV pilus assembly protein PilX
MRQLCTPQSRQRGISLLTVMVMMLLSLLLVLGGSRVGLLNERVAGNSTDYQRAYEAAEALLSEAQLDLLACMTPGCTPRAATLTSAICDAQSFANLQAQLLGNTPPCQDGVCLDLGTATNGDPATSFWGANNTAAWTSYTAAGRGARFGQFTGTTVTATQAVNPLLVNGAWYWIEILPYGASSGGARSVASEQTQIGVAQLKPNNQCSFLFRVTAAAQGRKTGTTAVLQSLYFLRPI